jgi:glycosyltransferase involved in cell wall biosynthesis
VIPCYNEAERLDTAAFLAFCAGEPAVTLLFVNDGSSDDTARVLGELRAARPEQIDVYSLDRNRGKAEAVRQGLLAALRGGAPVVGYLDADLATPLVEMSRLIRFVGERPDVDVLLASRVALLGRSIERAPARHYLGRVFASAASLMLHLRVYDTQCGAKLFRRTDALAAALAEPFLSRWIFDVELIGRLLAAPAPSRLAPARVREEPLLAWRDVKGSKLRGHHMAAAVRDLVRVGRDLARRRRAAGV